jgi:TPR repeat
LKLGQWTSAIADYDEALRLDPKLPTALYGRGFARVKAGDIVRGKAEIAAAKSHDQSVAAQFAHYGLQ